MTLSDLQAVARQLADNKSRRSVVAWSVYDADNCAGLWHSELGLSRGSMLKQNYFKEY